MFESMECVVYYSLYDIIVKYKVPTERLMASIMGAKHPTNPTRAKTCLVCKNLVDVCIHLDDSLNAMQISIPGLDESLLANTRALFVLSS